MPRNKASKPRNIIVAGANISAKAAAIIAASKAPMPLVTNTLPVGTVAALQAPHSNVAAPASAPALPQAPQAPATGEAPQAPVTPATPVRIAGVERTAATIAKHITNFAVFSDRDASYIAYYAPLAKRVPDGTVTVRAIAEYFRETGHAPAVPGSSAKPHDAGVIVRLDKAGFIIHAPDGHSFTFAPAVTAAQAPDKAHSNLLRARSIYHAAKAA